MFERAQVKILAHQGNLHQPRQSQSPSEKNHTVETQPESVKKNVNLSPVDAVTIAGEVIFFSLIITPLALTWIKSKVS